MKRIINLALAGFAAAALAANLGGMLAHQAALHRAIERFEKGTLSELKRQYNSGWGQLRSELRSHPGGGLYWVFMPRGLLHFLWLQFAEHAVGGTATQRCQWCDKPFETGTMTGRRSSSKFCSNACKLAAFRARHRPAA